MKKFLKKLCLMSLITILGFIILVIVTIFAVYGKAKSQYSPINLGEIKFCVAKKDPNLSYLTDVNGDVLIHINDILRIWGEYPYLYGRDTTGGFIIDFSNKPFKIEYVESYDVEKYLKVKNIIMNDMYSFWDFRQGIGNLEQLRESLKKK